MKKGFSLTELAIVMVIMGILAGMIIKGKDLMYSAQIKKELSTLRKMDMALNSYFTVNRTYPVRDNQTWSPFFKMSAFDAYIKPEDRVSGLSGTPWSYGWCKLEQDYNGKSQEWTNSVEGAVFMAINSEQSCIVSEATRWDGLQHMRQDVICAIDRTLDDGDPLRGRGRVHQGYKGSAKYQSYAHCKETSALPRIQFAWKASASY